MNWNQGRLVKLTALDADEYSRLTAIWMADAEYNRLLDSDPAVPLSAPQLRSIVERHAGDGERAEFLIKTLDGDKPIGFVGFYLGGNLRINGDAFVAIGIGEPGYRGRGYGSEALNLALAYAFGELLLHRVSLIVFGFNVRAIRSYEKLGFVREGTRREDLRRDGKWHDSIVMGILRNEWEAKNL